MKRAAKRAAMAVFLFLAAVAGSAWASDEPADFGPAYLIGPGDQLGIEIWKDPTLTRLAVVLPDGKISFPLIGDLVVAGKTVAALKKEIETKIARYVPDAVVTVEVRQINSMHVYVLGRVNMPGRAILSSNVNVLQALAIAGGPNTYANRSRIRVFRKEGGKTTIFPFDYDEVTAGRQPATNIDHKRGDVIFVP